jgi:hypothetical protein
VRTCTCPIRGFGEEISQRCGLDFPTQLPAPLGNRFANFNYIVFPLLYAGLMLTQIANIWRIVQSGSG